MSRWAWFLTYVTSNWSPLNAYLTVKEIIHPSRLSCIILEQWSIVLNSTGCPPDTADWALTQPWHSWLSYSRPVRRAQRKTFAGALRDSKPWLIFGQSNKHLLPLHQHMNWAETFSLRKFFCILKQFRCGRAFSCFFYRVKMCDYGSIFKFRHENMRASIDSSIL